jgi:uroporphyrinogen III methyltransferase / synthase
MAAARAGVVYLVGAGPGDPGLMTVRGTELLASADVILHDRLIPPGALEGARPDAEIVDVGKVGGGPQVPQAHTERLLLEHGARAGTVVRLKGGDPFVFGRGGEEALALREAGIPFEVVPGITAGIAAPAYAGIPVTHRDASSAVAFVTGHEDAELDWPALAAFPGTLVFYMGVKALPRIAERLVAGGRRGSEPAAVIERGTLPGQRTITAELGTIGATVAELGIRPPAITLIGPVAELHEPLKWLERRPLFGRTVVVTRARAQASGLAARLAELGAEVVETPAIRIEPRAVSGELVKAAEAIGDYSLICLTSPNGAALLMDALAELGKDARALGGATVAAIGPGTAAELQHRGIHADVVPERSVAEALVEALEPIDLSGKRVLIARAAEARDVLPNALKERGAEVDVVALYDTVAEPLTDAQREAAGRADYLTFTSSSTVRNFVESAGGVSDGTRVVSIGPVTSATAKELGLIVHVEAAQHDVDGLVQALLEDAATR